MWESKIHRIYLVEEKEESIYSKFFAGVRRVFRVYLKNYINNEVRN